MGAFPTDRVESVNNFCSSALVFSAAMTEVLESGIRESLGSKYTLPQLRLLAMVDKTDVQYVTEVAEFLNVSNAAASKAVDRLVKRGLIERRESKRDRRAIRLMMTEEGRRVIAEFESVQHRVFAGLFEDVPSGDLSQVARLIDRLSVELVDRTGTAEGSCLRCGIYFRDKCLLRETYNRSCRFHSSRRP